MSKTELKRLGTALFGKDWQSPLSRKIGVSDRTVRYWAAGTRKVPGPAAMAIRALAKEAR